MANTKYKANKGDKYNRWTVIEEVISNKGRTIKCKCDCGTEKELDFKNLRYGKTKSCGCYNLEKLEINSKTHGMAGTRIYKIYRGIVNRCNDKENKWYGMKGIKCEWKNFEEFYKDMKDGYAIDLTIDREDSTGNYCKSNCRWKTPKEQARNKENNRLYKGKCLAEWCEELGLNYKTIYSRINLYGWSYKDALEFNN